MGIRGLKTYLERHCPDACYEVDIAELVSDHERETGERVEIVVDGHSCFSMWYEELDWTIGIEVENLIENLRSFVMDFKNLDVKLTFFFGGLTPEKKRSTWLRRRVTIMNKMMNVFDMLNVGKSFENMRVEWNCIPPNMTNFVTFVLRHVLHCTVHVTVDDCDEEIIRYVDQNNSFAIFSQDTDFVVSDVNCRVLSVSDFNSSRMTTMIYDRDELCEYLNIDKGHLPLFGILAGNDYIDVELLKEFHNQQCNLSIPHIPYKKLFNSLAEYINNLPSPGYLDSEELIERVCSDVFDCYENEEKMLLAYNSYFPMSRPVSPPQYNARWSRVLSVAEERLRNVLLPVSAWGVISKQVYESSPCLEDLRVTNDNNDDNPREIPSATMTRPLRKRWCGILLYEIKDTDPVVTEWCAENVDSYKNPVTIQPVYPQAHHPGLRALWDENRSEIHYQNKWRLFLGAVASRRPIHNIGAWMNLPPDLIVATAACYYLYMEEDCIGVAELRTVLATLAMYSSFDSDDLDYMYDGRSNERAMQITINLTRTNSIVFSLFASCGYPEPLNEETAHIRFEPKLFQYLYQKVRNERGYDRLYGHYDCADVYDQMYDTIHG